ncbi:hypothetical protein C0J52_17080 [Blattella germanica]|nr:hypothetical protein C0J52_17080 [Blattella germanica]
MYLPFSTRRRQPFSCLLFTTLAILLSFSTITNCSSTTTDSATKRTTVTENPHITNNAHSHRVTEFSKYVTKSSERKTGVEFSRNISKTTQEKTQKNASIEHYSKWDLGYQVGLQFLKILSKLNCSQSNSAVECAKDTVIKYIHDVLYENEITTNEISEKTPSLSDIKVVRNLTALQETVLRKLSDLELTVNLPRITGRGLEYARAGLSLFKPAEGKSSFLTGFGLGFLAFGLKKLLLPLFIGAQIVKSVLIAMFLPSILGGLGKLVGKGVTTFASASGSSGPSSNNVDDFEFKDNMGFDNMESATAESKYSSMFQYPENYGYQQSGVSGLPAGTLPASALYMPGTAQGSLNRYDTQGAGSKLTYSSLPSGAQHHYGSYYTRHQQPTKKQDYKVFHNIPSSSLLLTNYDPFYSPLLSRLDSVFKQLGYESESCRERLVCAMYNNPAKELNELRKPSTDNPEILRFFRYMKAAKDGQDSQDCIRMYPGCTASNGSTNTHPPMIKTYHDINKLVQARRLSRSMNASDSHNTNTTETAQI